MIKGFLLLFSLLGLFLCGLFFTFAVSLSQIVPSSAQIDDSFMVQVAINKGDLKGVAKFSEQLPAGFTAMPIDKQGAKTSFSNNVIQFSWDSLPPDNILNISFRVDVSNFAAAIKDTLMAKFFYSQNEQKVEADGAPSYITIVGISVPVTEMPPQATNSVDAVGQETTNMPGNDKVFAERRFSSASIPPGSDAKITVIMHKPNVIGFAKIEDSIPPGFTASGADLGGASFTLSDNVVKFVWKSIPSDSVITVSYNLHAGANVSGIYAVSGNFSCILGKTPIIHSMGTTIFNTTRLKNSDASANIASEATGNSIAPQSMVTKPEGNTLAPKNTAANPAGNSSLPRIVKTVSASPVQTDVKYRVQLMALHNSVDVSYFSLKYKINAAINTELEEGFTKYTVGSYSDYKLVRDGREEYRKIGIVGPFVVAYNSGKRITVQEALMISHQKWCR